jgi:hypothetical protein
MKTKFEILLAYLAARGREPGTWKCMGTALVYLGSRYGITLTPEECMFYSGIVYVAVGIFAPDAKAKADVIGNVQNPSEPKP